MHEHDNVLIIGLKSPRSHTKGRKLLVEGFMKMELCSIRRKFFPEMVQKSFENRFF